VSISIEDSFLRQNPIGRNKVVDRVKSAWACRRLSLLPSEEDGWNESRRHADRAPGEEVPPWQAVLHETFYAATSSSSRRGSKIQHMNDLRLAVRMLARSRAFALVAVALLVVGIGANALIFSAFDAILWRPLPVRHPEELVRMVQHIPRIGTSSTFHYSFYQALRDRSTTLSAIFGEAAIDVAMSQPTPAEQVRVHMATPEFFQVLGTPALAGRTLTEDDAKVNSATPSAVLSYDFWRRRFNADPDAVGRTIVLHARPFVIVGVMPRAFNGTSVDTAPDIRVPLSSFEVLWSEPQTFSVEEAALDLGARLKSGVTRAQAQAETLAIWRAAIEPYSVDNPHGRGVYDQFRTGMELDPLERGVSILRERYAGALSLLIVSVGLLQLMVCANVTGLLLTRIASRRGEIAVRLALGATRGRLAKQMFVESLLLTGLGAIGGALLAFAASPWVARALPPIRDIAARRLTLAADFDPDLRVLLFALAISVSTALLSGVAIAITVWRTKIESMLRGARASGAWRGRQAIVVFQIALCTLLLTCAGLLVRTFEQLHSVNAGFDRDHIVTFTANPSLSGYTASREQALLSALIGRVREIPDVVSVALAQRGVLRGRGIGMTAAPVGQQPSTADFLGTNLNVVSPEYFVTMGMQLVAGRDFTIADDPDVKPGKVLVNQAFVRRFFPNVDPLGQQFGAGLPQRVVGPMFEIIGVVSDAKYRSLREPMMPTVYQLSREFDLFVLHVRTRGGPESIVQPVRQALAALDPALPFAEISTLAEEADASTAGERVTAALASFFGTIAALLSAVGLYGLLAYIVAQRRREIGIRMALGAQIADIGLLIGRTALAMVVGGMALGLGAAAAGTQWIRSLLYGVAPSDPRSLAVAAVFVALVAAVAIAISVMGATQIEPAAALRQEN
jgi:putative ABC transport system permease protein